MSNLENISKLENINNFSNFIRLSPDLFEDKYNIVNINGNLKIVKKDEHLMIEHIKSFMDQKVENSRQIVVYIYLEEYKTNNMRISFIQKISNLLQNGYPDALYKCFIMNAPKYFNIVYKIISLMLDKETKSKIYFQNCEILGNQNQ